MCKGGILVYLGHSLGVAGRDRSVLLLFRPFHSVVEQRQRGLFLFPSVKF